MPGPASSEGDRLLCKFLSLSDHSSQHAAHKVFFKREEITLQKCLTARLRKMSEILQPWKNWSTEKLSSNAQSLWAKGNVARKIGSMAHGLKRLDS